MGKMSCPLGARIALFLSISILSSLNASGMEVQPNIEVGESPFFLMGNPTAYSIISFASIPTVVEELWHLSSMAYTLYALLLTCLIVLFLRLRFLRLRKLNLELREIIVEHSRKIAIQADEIEQKNSVLKNTAAQLEMAVARTEQGSRAKSVFLADMSHELKTPMTGVIGMSSLLDSTDLTPEQQKFVGIIRNSGEKLLSVINGVLDFSKIESGKLDLKTKKFDLRKVIEEVLNLLASRLADKDVELFYELEENVPPFLIGDADRISQILKNLIINAIKYTHQGHIQIRVRADIHSTCDSNQIPLRFSITDSGIGISEERKKYLFEPFTQIDIIDPSQKPRGTGLGLPISRQLINMMGGTIDVLSKRGVGSTFFFTINLKVHDSEISDFCSKGLRIIRNQRALVLVYNYDLRKAILRQLNRWKIHGQDASGIEESMTLLRNECHLNYLILDERFLPPKRTELLDEIIALRKERSFHIIILQATPDSRKNSRPCHTIENITTINKPVCWREMFGQLHNGECRQPKKSATTNTILSLTEESNLSEFAAKYPMKLLVAEDNEINQEVITELLTHLGYSIDIATDGKEAVELSIKRTYDAILMDIHMPVMDGRKATSQLRDKLLNEQQPVVIAVTASTSTEDRQKCLDAGINLFLAKPIKMQDLMNSLLDAFLILKKDENSDNQV